VIVLSWSCRGAIYRALFSNGYCQYFLHAKTVDTSRRGDTIRAVNSKKIEGRKTWLTGRR
jgi:hypothetical protein